MFLSIQLGGQPAHLYLILLIQLLPKRRGHLADRDGHGRIRNHRPSIRDRTAHQRRIQDHVFEHDLCALVHDRIHAQRMILVHHRALALPKHDLALVLQALDLGFELEHLELLALTLAHVIQHRSRLRGERGPRQLCDGRIRAGVLGQLLHQRAVARVIPAQYVHHGRPVLFRSVAGQEHDQLQGALESDNGLFRLPFPRKLEVQDFFLNLAFLRFGEFAPDFASLIIVLLAHTHDDVPNRQILHAINDSNPHSRARHNLIEWDYSSLFVILVFILHQTAINARFVGLT